MANPTCSTGAGPRLPDLVDGCDSHIADEERPMLLESLESSDRFRRDTGIGNIFHSGKISYREASDVDSLHIMIDGNRISAHIDEISPLRRKRDGTLRYSVARILAHNLSGIGADISRRLRGKHGQQRCNLECDVVWVADDAAEEREPVPNRS